MVDFSYCTSCGKCCHTDRPDEERHVCRIPVFGIDTECEYAEPLMSRKYLNEEVIVSCEYLCDKTGTCTEYLKRPMVCRWYPLYPIVRDEESSIGVSTHKMCKVGRDIAESFMEGDSSTIEFVKKIKSEMSELLSMKELKEWSDRNMSNYSVVTELRFINKN